MNSPKHDTRGCHKSSLTYWFWTLIIKTRSKLVFFTRFGIIANQGLLGFFFVFVNKAYESLHLGYLKVKFEQARTNILQLASFQSKLLRNQKDDPHVFRNWRMLILNWNIRLCILDDVGCLFSFKVEVEFLPMFKRYFSWQFIFKILKITPNFGDF